MTTARSGVLAGGNWIVDRVNIVDRYPDQDGLAYVLDQTLSNGGSPYNVLTDLARLEAPFPLAGVGIVGEDASGEFILADCRAHGIDTSALRRTSAAATSYTEVMTVQSTGRRTFFHRRGANSLLDEHDFPLHTSRARIFHLGYLLLLDRLDVVGADGLTGAARLFQLARTLGFKTSADLVSEQSERYAAVIDPSLPWLDYLFLNDFEAERLTGVRTRSGEAPDWQGMSRAATALIDRGVRELVCIHSCEGAVARTRAGGEIRQPRVRVPGEMIAGTVGAGDAIAAGVLLGRHEGWDLEASLQLGVSAAAACLLRPGSSDGVLPAPDCLRLGQQFGFGE